LKNQKNSFADKLLNLINDQEMVLESRSERIAALENRLREFLTFDQAITSLAAYIVFSDEVKATFSRLKLDSEMTAQSISVNVEKLHGQHETIADLTDKYIGIVEKNIEATSNRGKNAADAKHNKPGGSRHKKAAIRTAWASGKYSSRDICAEQECAELGMSFSTARKALIGTPKPT